MIANIARFVETEARVYRHRKYCYGYILCLVLNLANVVFNILLLDIFLGGDFLYLGARYKETLHTASTIQCIKQSLFILEDKTYNLIPAQVSKC